MTLDTAAAVVKVNDATGAATQSNTFQIEGAVLLWDAITLDSALQEKYFAQLASGGTLLYETTQFSTSEVFCQHPPMDSSQLQSTSRSLA